MDSNTTTTITKKIIPHLITSEFKRLSCWCLELAIHSCFAINVVQSLHQLGPIIVYSIVYTDRYTKPTVVLFLKLLEHILNNIRCYWHSLIFYIKVYWFVAGYEPPHGAPEWSCCGATRVPLLSQPCRAILPQVRHVLDPLPNICYSLHPDNVVKAKRLQKCLVSIFPECLALLFVIIL